MGKHIRPNKKRERKVRAAVALAVLSLLFVMAAVACGAEKNPVASSEPGSVTADNRAEIDTEPITDNPAEADSESAECFIDSEGMTLETRFPTPEGYGRVNAEPDSFGSFLRDYPLLPDGEPVHLYDGSEKGSQNDHAAVFDMELVEGDLQQCADSVLRLYAEYFYRTSQYGRINFHLTNGFLLSFDKWRSGMRVSVDGNETSWVAGAGASDSEETFEAYLRFLFCYAGTVSMGAECEPVDIANLQAGDVFLYSGSPGHVVLVLDVCENADGEKAFLLGQGYMPAQQFHVLKNPAHTDNPWYYASEVTYPFRTPEYTFDEGSLMRPDY